MLNGAMTCTTHSTRCSQESAAATIRDFGKVEDLAKALQEGFVYSWVYSNFRKRHHGSSSLATPGCKFFVFSQNHDQVETEVWETDSPCLSRSRL